MNFYNLTNIQKITLGLLVGLIMSLFLPWYSISASSNFNVMGQSYGGSSSSTITGINMGFSYLTLILAIAVGYFILAQNFKVAFYISLGLLLNSINVYFNIVGFGDYNVSASAGAYGSVKSSAGYSFGFYIFTILALAISYLSFKESKTT